MYAAYFNLSDNPFSITPDPAYLYLSPHHQEALGHLLYGTGEDGGFVQLTGEVGTGKTTIIRALLKQDMHNVDVALCLNPCLTVEEFLAAICDELHIEYPSNATLKTLVDALNTRLLERHSQGRRTVLIVDEAQNLSPAVLEQIRLLTNLETHRHKLLRIILVGQPELQDVLERRDLRQLAQRITARYHLRPLTREETGTYIRHRLAVAGCQRELFTPAALRAVHWHARGIPRLVNIICDRALLGAYAQNLNQVDRKVVRRAAREALQGPNRRRARLRRYADAAVVPLAVGLAFGGALYLWQKVRDPVVIEVPVPSAVAIPGSGRQAGNAGNEAKAPISPPLQESLAALPADDDAMRRLLGLWGAGSNLPNGRLSCEEAESRGLRCLSGSGGWSELRRFDHPAILSLQLDNGETREVLLSGLQGEHAVLELPGGRQAVSRNDLDALWVGDFLLLWRPPLPETLIGPSTVGEPVRWLRRQLSLADGKPLETGAGADYFDEALRDRLRAFQTARGLTADGLAGSRTLILLVNLSPSANVPRLSVTPEAG